MQKHLGLVLGVTMLGVAGVVVSQTGILSPGSMKGQLMMGDMMSSVSSETKPAEAMAMTSASQIYDGCAANHSAKQEACKNTFDSAKAACEGAYNDCAGNAANEEEMSLCYELGQTCLSNAENSATSCQTTANAELQECNAPQGDPTVSTNDPPTPPPSPTTQTSCSNQYEVAKGVCEREQTRRMIDCEDVRQTCRQDCLKWPWPLEGQCMISCGLCTDQEDYNQCMWDAERQKLACEDEGKNKPGDPCSEEQSAGYAACDTAFNNDVSRCSTDKGACIKNEEDSESMCEAKEYVCVLGARTQYGDCRRSVDITAKACSAKSSITPGA